MRLAVSSSVRRCASNTALSPDAIITSSPLAATAGPPITGVSSIEIPAAARRSAAIARESAGVIVLMSHTAGEAPEPAMPRGPSATSRTAAASLTHMTTRGHRPATSAGDSATSAPAPSSAAAFFAVRLCTTTSRPRPIRRDATAAPSIPVPTTPTAPGMIGRGGRAYFSVGRERFAMLPPLLGLYRPRAAEQRSLQL